MPKMAVNCAEEAVRSLSGVGIEDEESFLAALTPLAMTGSNPRNEGLSLWPEYGYGERFISLTWVSYVYFYFLYF
jgi:hypothetical protein